MKRSLRLIAMILAVFAVLCSPAMAEQGDNNIRFGIQWVSPTGDFLDDLFRIDLEPQSAVGVAFSYERMVTDLVGIEAGIGYSNHDLDETFTVLGQSETETVGDIAMMPLLVGANFHVLRKEKVDLYLGAQIGYVAYGDVKIEDKDPDQSDISMKNGFGYGLIAGVDVPFGASSWMFNGSLAWLSTDADFDEPGAPSDGIAIDPIVVRIGVGTRF